MKIETCSAVRLSLAATALAAVFASAQAQPAPQAWPSKPVDITVGFAAGGGVDFLARMISTQLSAMGHTAIVENRPGAGGTMGVKHVVGRPKDGHSLLMMNDAYSLAPAIFKTLGYDPKKDIAPVVNIAWAPMLVIVPANSRFKTLGDVVAEGRKGKINYGSCGAGTDPHLAGEMMNISFKMNNLHVPYKGCGPAIIDTLGGQVDLAVVTISGALPHIASGKLRALAITSKDRSKVVPDVPTVAESGAPGFELSQWQGLAVPAGTPEDVKMEIYRTISTMMKSPANQKKLLELGYTPADENPGQFTRTVNNDIDRFDSLAKKIGLTVE